MTNRLNPYSNLPSERFWRTAVTTSNPYNLESIHQNKFSIDRKTKIATAGSCFAQHIARHLREREFTVLDAEPAPKGLPRELHQKYGFSMYSARYGNIYTVKQLLQLAKEVSGARVPEDYILESEGKFYDGLRPSVEPEGFQKKSDVIEQRKIHIKKVKWVFQNMDLFIFTLGLTEMWVARESGTVFPTAPGTVKGKFDKRKYKFKNSHYKQILNAFNAFQKEVRNIRDGRKFNVLLTVSPVPLTATASAKHALVATTHSKSILRAVAGKLADNQDHIDYFPSYEIATNPRLHSTAFSENLRTIRGEAVKNVMNHFFNVYDKEPFQIKHSHEKLVNSRTERIDDTLVQCEEQLLEAFGN